MARTLRIDRIAGAVGDVDASLATGRPRPGAEIPHA
jgi:hypothetical protein